MEIDKELKDILECLMTYTSDGNSVKDAKYLEVIQTDLCMYFKGKKVVLPQANVSGRGEQLKTKFYLGQKVKVCGDLETVIERIEGDKYYFFDEMGREWCEVADAIEAM